MHANWLTYVGPWTSQEAVYDRIEGKTLDGIRKPGRHSILKSKHNVESVQCKFTKRLPGMKMLSYHQRLAEFGLESLELKRLCSDLLFTYKLVLGIINLKLSNFFIPNFHRNSCRRQYQLYLPTCKSSIRYNSYLY